MTDRESDKTLHAFINGTSNKQKDKFEDRLTDKARSTTRGATD